MNRTCHSHRFSTRLIIGTGLTVVALIGTAPSMAQQIEQRRNGDHPAIVVQRLQQSAGYDYAAKFYPHPAWLYLAAEAPRELGHHPAVIVARRAAPVASAEVPFAHPATALRRAWQSPTATAPRGQ